MNIDIYYFSGTGNSFAVARDIAKRLDASLYPIPKMINKKGSTISSKIVGFVFPDYHSNIPNIVRRFIEDIDTLRGKYIFGICTYGHDPGPTLSYLKDHIGGKDGILSAGFAVKMPYNYIKPRFSLNGISVGLEDIPENEQKKMFMNWENRVDYILDNHSSQSIVIEKSYSIH